MGGTHFSNGGRRLSTISVVNEARQTVKNKLYFIRKAFDLLLFLLFDINYEQKKSASEISAA